MLYRQIDWTDLRQSCLAYVLARKTRRTVQKHPSTNPFLKRRSFISSLRSREFHHSRVQRVGWKEFREITRVQQRSCLFTRTWMFHTRYRWDRVFWSVMDRSRSSSMLSSVESSPSAFPTQTKTKEEPYNFTSPLPETRSIRRRPWAALIFRRAQKISSPAGAL